MEIDSEANAKNAGVDADARFAQDALPSVPEDITREWLAKALGLDISTIAINETILGTATKVFVTIVYEDNSPADTKPTQLCLKGGFDPNIIKAMPWIVMLYQRECEFYNQIAPKLSNMELPQCWWAGHNDTQGIVAIENLAAKGCEFGNPVETWPVSRVLAGVEQLAALHAKTWHVESSTYPWLTSDYDQHILALVQTYDAVVKGPDRPSIPEYLKDQERITNVLKKHYALRNPRFRCLLHGDTHTGNTYLVNGVPRFLDCQVIHIGSAFHDLSYFIGSALTVEDRREHEWEIVSHYLRILEKFGGEALSISDEEVITEYKKGFLAGVGWIMCPYTMQPKECVYPMALRYAAALDDHKVLELVEGLPAVS